MSLLGAGRIAIVKIGRDLATNDYKMEIESFLPSDALKKKIPGSILGIPPYFIVDHHMLIIL
jgi:hypothetical protein